GRSIRSGRGEKGRALSSNVELHHHRHMIRRLLPAAHYFHDPVRLERALQALTGPDVIQPAAAIRCFPILGAITPPAKDFLLRRDEVTGGIDPVESGLRLME